MFRIRIYSFSIFKNFVKKLFFPSFRAATAAKDAKDWSLPSFGSHLNPISTRGADYAQPILSPWLAKIRRGGSDLYVVHSDLGVKEMNSKKKITSFYVTF